MNDNGELNKFIQHSITSYRFFHADRIDNNVDCLKAFAVQQGVSEDMVEKFIDYNLFNGNGGHLCDRQGNLIRNVYGAFLGFAKSGYDRTIWEQEHGLSSPL